MLKSYNFPSVYEATNQELANVAENILDGLKINLDDTDYIVGNLALVEGYSPHKSINAAPTDEEYKLLSEASLLLTQPKGEEEIYLTTGSRSQLIYSTGIKRWKSYKDDILSITMLPLSVVRIQPNVK